MLVFQDVHWADHGTLDFIDHLVEWSREFPVLIVSLSRPEILDERPEWGAARRSFTTMYLEPIGEAAMRELLVGLAPSLPEPTIQAILSSARTGDVGDGKIFVQPLEQVIRIRTGEQDNSALTAVNADQVQRVAIETAAAEVGAA